MNKARDELRKDYAEFCKVVKVLELEKEIQSLKEQLKRERECVDFYADYKFKSAAKALAVVKLDELTKRARETKAKR